MESSNETKAAALKRFTNPLIQLQLSCFLQMLGRYCHLYKGMKHFKTENYFEYFKTANLPHSRKESERKAYLARSLESPTIESVVNSMLIDQKREIFFQLTRSLGIPCSRYAVENISKTKSSDNVYEYICKIYRDNLKLLFRKEIQVIPVDFCNADHHDNYRWVLIKETGIHQQAKTLHLQHSPPTPVKNISVKKVRVQDSVKSKSNETHN